MPLNNPTLLIIFKKLIEKDEKYEFYKNPEFSLQFIKANFEKGTLEANLEAKQLLRYALKEPEIKKEVLGKNQKDIISVLKNKEGIGEVKIKLKPYWLFKIPNNPLKVKISID